jgi:hypothetical protein
MSLVDRKVATLATRLAHVGILVAFILELGPYRTSNVTVFAASIHPLCTKQGIALDCMFVCIFQISKKGKYI